SSTSLISCFRGASGALGPPGRWTGAGSSEPLNQRRAVAASIVAASIAAHPARQRADGPGRQPSARGRRGITHPAEELGVVIELCQGLSTQDFLRDRHYQDGNGATPYHAVYTAADQRVGDAGAAVAGH